MYATRPPGINKHGRTESLRGRESFSSPAVQSLSSTESFQGFRSSTSTDLHTWQNHATHPAKMFHSRTSLMMKTSEPFSINTVDPSIEQGMKLSPLTPPGSTVAGTWQNC